MGTSVWRRCLVVTLSTILVIEAGAITPTSPVLAAPEAANTEPGPPDDPPVAQPAEDPAAEPVELVEERTASSRTFDNGDGTFTTKLYTDPIHYHPGDDAEADWLPIEVGFEEIEGARAESDLIATSTKSPVEVSIGANTRDDGFLVLEADGRGYAISLTSVDASRASLNAPVIDNARADWADFLPGVDLRVIAGAEDAKTFLILETPPATPEWTFLIDAPGLTAGLADDGSVGLFDTDKQQVARIPAPYAVDSSESAERGGGEMTDQVRLAVGQREGRIALTISVDAGWLAKATYPVYIDPSLDFEPSTTAYGDAFVSTKYPTMNFADYVRPDSPYYHEHWLGMDPTDSGNVNKVLVRFDVAVLEDAAIDLARLWIYPYHQYYNAPTATTTWANRVTAGWAENTVTENNQPGSSSPSTSASFVEGQLGYLTLTGLVQDWADDTYPNYGVKLHENGNNGTHWKRLISHEQGGALDDYGPVLEVTWHFPVAVTTKPYNWTTSRNLDWDISDPESHGQSHYQVQVATDSAFSSIVWDSGAVSSSTTNVNIPGGITLSSGGLYYWRVKVKDGYGWSAWDSSMFLWDTTAPSGTVSINGGAGSTNSSSVRVDLSSADLGTTNAYHNDGRSLGSIAGGCASTTCGSSWATPDLALSPTQGAIVAAVDSTTWHSLTVDASGSNRSIMAFDVMRDGAHPVQIGIVSNDNDGYRFEMRAITSPYQAFTSFSYTRTSTAGSYTTESGVSIPFVPGVWYRFIVSSTGHNPGTYNMWWYERDAPISATPAKIVTDLYLPNPRLHIFSKLASGTDPTHLWLDDIKVAKDDANPEYGSGTTAVRFSTDGGTNWSAWTGYADKLDLELPPGSGTRTVHAQFRDAAGNASSGTGISDSIGVTFGNFGRQPQHSFESWDLGGGGAAAVNMATGNLVVSHPRVSLPYRGGNALPLGLTYNAQVGDNVGVGPGWQLDLQRRLILNGDSTVTFVDADGARHTFTNPETAGSVTTYTRPASLYATLVKDTGQSSEFTLTYRDQSRDRFQISGSVARLMTIEDRHGNTLTLAYDGAGNLSTVTDPASRVVDFTWDTTPTPDRLTTISDWAWINGSGEVQTAASGSRRTYRLFYDGSGNLSGWSDPLNTAGSCPTPASGRTCLGYSGGLLGSIGKTQTYTTFDDVNDTLGTSARTVITGIEYAGSVVETMTDAEGRTTTFDPDSSDRVVVRRPMTTTVYSFGTADAHARVTSVWRDFDAMTAIERRTTWDATYPIEPASVTDNYGAVLATPARTTSFTYLASSLGLLTKLVEPLTATDDRWTEYTYNANNDVTQVVVSAEGSGTDRTVTRYCYSSAAACPSANGLTLLAEIQGYSDGTGGSGAGTDDADTDVRTDFAYDGNGQRISVVRHNYDGAGTLLDEREDRFEYDGAGNITAEIVNAADGDVTGGWDVDPDPATSARTDLTTSHTYDTAGNRVSTADPRRAIRAVTGSPDPDDFLTRWTYDALNRLIRETTPTTPDVDIAQRDITTVHDELGLVRMATDFGELTIATRYDRTGIATSSYEQPDGEAARQTSLTTLDAAGRPSTSKDERQLAPGSTLGPTQWAYDALGREIAVAAAVGTTTATENDTGYDALDRRTSLEIGIDGAIGGTSASSLRTRYAYDLGGRLLEADDDFACTRETFDYQDRPLTSTSGLLGNGCGSGADQRTITHSYDAVGRLVRDEVTAGAGTGDRTTDDTFDAVGNRLSAATRKSGVTQTTTFAVNLLNQVTAESRPDGSLSKATYDPAGNAADRCFWRSGSGDVCKAVGSSWSVDDPDQVTTTGYDARNQRISLRNGATNGETLYDPDHNYQVAAIYTPTSDGREHQTLFEYDARHRLAGEGVDDPAVTVQVCTADTDHDCTDTATVVATDIYAYDDNDNRTRVEEFNGTASADRRYCYDAVDRLIYRNTDAACSTSAKDETYAFDDAGNRTSMVVGGVTTGFTYDAQGRLTAAGGEPITYDTAGRIRSWDTGTPVWYFTYDPEARLISACRSATCAAGSDKVEFTYDGEGHRTKIVATAAGGTVKTTEFRYQGDAVVEEKVNGAIARTFVVAEAGAIVKMNIPSGGNAGNYLVSWNGHGDALHLLRIVDGGTTELANSFTYSTWGTPTVDGSHDNSANGGADYGDLGFRYLYVGEFDVQWDNTFGLGLQYMHARHYAPALGRFLQPDPDGLEDSLYAYAANNPVTEIDPDGTCFIVCQVVVGAIIGAAIETAVYLATTDSSQWDFGTAVSMAASGAAMGAATSVGMGAVGLAARATVRATSAAVRAASPAVRSAASQASRGLSSPQLALATGRGPRWTPQWRPPTRAPRVSPGPHPRPYVTRPPDLRGVLRGSNPNLIGGGMRAPRPCAGHGLRCVGYGIGIGLLATAATVRYLAPRRE